MQSFERKSLFPATRIFTGPIPNEMSGVNKVILVGNLGADPEVRHLQNGTAVANLRIATTEYFKDRQTGDRREQTEWHDVVVWRQLAEISEKYLRKGSKVYVEGKLRTRKWQDKDGHDRKSVEIIADEMKMLDRREQTQGNAQQPTSASTSSSDQPVEMRDEEVDALPF